MAPARAGSAILGGVDHAGTAAAAVSAEIAYECTHYRDRERTHMKQICSALLLCVPLALIAAGVAQSAERLKYLGYSGNEKPEFYQKYFDKYGAVDFSISGTSQEIKQKITAGFPADVVNPCVNAGFYALANNEYFLPLDYSKIPNAAHLLPSMQNLPSYKAADGKVYYVPREHGSMVWVYLKDKFSNKPTSALEFLDDAYKGRIAVSAAAEDVMWLAGKLVGVDVWQAERLTPEQVDKMTQGYAKLLSSSRLLLTSSAEGMQAITSGEVDAIYMYDDGFSLMKKEGLNVAVQYDATEGLVWWQCGLAIMKNHSAPLDQIYDYIDAVLDTDAQAKLLRANGLFVVNADAYAKMSPEELDTLGLDTKDPAAAFAKFEIHHPGNQENLAQLTKLWEALKAQR